MLPWLQKKGLARGGIALRHLVVKARIGWTFPPGPRLVRQPQAFSGGKTVYSSGLGRRKPRHFTPHLGSQGKALGPAGTTHPTKRMVTLPPQEEWEQLRGSRRAPGAELPSRSKGTWRSSLLL